MKSKLFVPIALGLVAMGAVALYQMSHGPSLLDDTARAASINEQFTPRPAPDFTLNDLAGNPVSLSTYKGKVVVLNFWASWCPPCKKEIPDFNELQKTYAGDGVQFIGIANKEPRLFSRLRDRARVKSPKTRRIRRR